MIVEAFKLMTSALPFIKEAFLWRDGAELGKPITKKNLIRRKVAVFVLLGSLVLNYLFVNHMYKSYVHEAEVAKQMADLKKEKEELLKSNEQLRVNNASCVHLSEVVATCEEQIEHLVQKGSLLRQSKGKTKKTNP